MQVRKKASDAESDLNFVKRLMKNLNSCCLNQVNESFKHNGKSNRSNPACPKFLFVWLTTEA
ncbi:hypothetical protein [Bacillus haynesii]|uniref:hypothetical protein n=1 Tax=Bacillus haynesii TaxID=1925021 RepID=UPI0035DD4D6F